MGADRIVHQWPWLQKMVRRAQYAMAQSRFKKVEAEARESGRYTYTDDDLVYAAWSRCECGAGLAYPRGCGPHHHWDCSDILTDRAIPSGQPGAARHTDKLPFVFWDIKSEGQLSAGKATTRGRDS